MKELSIVIPFMNEGENLKRTLISIMETATCPIDVIIVNDNSTDGYPYKQLEESFGIRMIENDKRIGPAACREMGISAIETPYFLTVDAHMQFGQDDWCNAIIEQLKKKPKSIYCCQTKVLNEDWGIEAGTPYGAKINFTDDEKLLEPEWIYDDISPDSGLIKIPCVLGATYFTSKSYWKYLRGLEGLKMYGNEEPYISMKAWMEGGGCFLLKSIAIGHMYRKVLPFSDGISYQIYNKLLIAETLFSADLKQTIYSKIEKLSPDEFKEAKEWLIKDYRSIKELKLYYKTILSKDINSYITGCGF